MRKNRIITISLREIKKSKKRFFSLCVLSILGVSFFIGMKISGPTMIKSLDTYYDNNKMYDLKIISTLGLDNDDLIELNKLNNDYKVSGSHTKDVIFNDGKHESVLRIQEIISGMNKFDIIKGRMPQKYNEIIVEEGFEYKTNYKIGDKIKLKLEDNDNTIKTTEVEIVGIVLSPEYVNNSHVTQSRGNTSLGNGQIAYYSYALNELFNFDYYTEIYIEDDVATNFETNSKKYLKRIDKDISLINTIADTREKDRYNKIINEANKKLKEQEDKANTELSNAKEKLDKAKKELDKAKKTLDNTKTKLDKGYKEIQNGYSTLKKSKDSLEKAHQKLKNGKEEIEKNLKNSKAKNITYNKLATFVKKYDSSSFSIADLIKLFGEDNININEIVDNSLVNIKTIANKYGINLEKLLDKYGINTDFIVNKTEVKLSEILDAATISQIKKLIIDDEFIILIKESIPKDNRFYDKIVKYLDEFSNVKNTILELFNGIRNIENGYIEYNKNLNLINSNEKKLNSLNNQYYSNLNKYNSGLKQYNSNLDLYNKNKSLYEENEKKVKDELDAARKEIDSIEHAKWFIQTREDNNEYITYISSYDSIENLANIFPIIFFIVSIMISLLSMSRMAIENRSEIGTLKALGFSNHEIRLKYIIYSSLATLIGGIIGALIGYFLIPKVIIEVFKIMHNIPTTVYSTNMMPIILGLTLSIICIVGSTILTINNLVREKATTLLRPMAPPIGKKILIEKIPFIWKRFSYSNKLTIRNIFRFKRRIIMSLFGIASCTMILLAGYGIKDSISYVVDKQYNEINHNDVLISLDGKLEAKELNNYINNEGLDFNVYAKIDQVKLKNKRLSMIIPDDKNEFKKALTIIDSKTKKEVTLKENYVVITEKLAEYFNLKVGDEVSILENNNASYTFKISNICENYIGDYIYMSKDTYKNSIGKYSINTQYLKFKDLNKENEIMNNIKNNNPHILSTISISNTKAQVDVLFKSLNLIVYVLIVFSGALSFVVFYSLAYINISERQREIATLKVLGFYYQEIDLYIMKEELITTIMGIFVGLTAGTLYSYKLIDSLEINTMQYIKNIHLDSYLKTSGFILLFALIVSIGIHFTLKRIRLIESLKSVE